ncbi:MAG TPA: aminotransferase class V-fold PLP-dependent enzyme [Vicinamibacterales bacterium]|nr:aminotransferase class V-fold PLP-dependent enzyme [Vicinamibacterales bacterium]
MTVYLDWAATTPLDPIVREEMLRYLGDDFGNAGSRTHRWGQLARQGVERARDRIAAVVAAGRSEVIFTSGATESNNLAILGLAADATARHVVSTAIEHHAVLEPLDELRRRGFEIALVPPERTGAVNADAVLSAVRPDTLLVSVMHANNETGVLQPIAQIAEGLRQSAAFFHVDAAQTFGRELETLKHPRIDLISASAHKINGPKGVGALIARRRHGARVPLRPLMFGGGQELGLRPGTMPVALIAGFGVAAELAASRAPSRLKRCRGFRDALVSGLAPLSPAFNGDIALAVPYIINFSLPGIDSEVAIDAWRDLVAVSNGAACTSQSYTCSHVLAAMGVPASQSDGALRFSWGADSPQPDWAALVAALEPHRLSRARGR